MENLTINIYDEKGKVKKTSEAKLVDIEFGTVRKLMAILKIDSMENTFDILAAVNDAWEDIKMILSKVFPDLTDEELDSVKLKELLPVILQVIKYSFAEIVNIPSNEKN